MGGDKLERSPLFWPAQISVISYIGYQGLGSGGD